MNVRYLLFYIFALLLCNFAYAQAPGKPTLVHSSTEPLPNCIPAVQGQLQQIIWDITAQSLDACTSLNSWTPVGSGGSGAPAGNLGDIQDKASSSLLGASHLNDSQTYPNQMTLNGGTGYLGLSIHGPRPYVDVTAYGAYGDGVHDDTVAIQAAFNAVCVGFTGLDSGPAVYFPPGRYLVNQPQIPSTKPVFDFSSSGSGCAPAMFSGKGGTFDGLLPTLSDGAEIEVQKGASPNNQPVMRFALADGNGYGCDIQGLNISGYNRAIDVIASQPCRFDNVSLQAAQSGQTDNAELKLTSTFWFFWNGGTIGNYTNGVHDIPTVLMTGENIDGAVSNVIDVTFQNMIFGDGPIIYDQRVPISGGIPGNWNFINDTIESDYDDLLKIIESNGPVSGGWGVNGITMINTNMADSADDTAAVVSLNASDAYLTGVDLINTGAGNGGGGVAIRQIAGDVVSYNISSCYSFCSYATVDSSGNQVGGGIAQQGSGGIDVTASTVREVDWPHTDDRLQSQNAQNAIGNNSPATRWFAVGNQSANYGVDSQLGFLFNNGNSQGFSSVLGESTLGEIDLGYADDLPPTSLSGTATTGGSLPAGTYTAVIRSTTTNCSTDQSGPSAIATGVVVGGSNNAITWVWTVPNSNLYVGTLGGYCLTSGVSANQYTTKYVYISGAGTTSYTQTAAISAGGINSLSNNFSTPAWHKFQANLVSFGTSNVQFGSIGIGAPSVSPSYVPACLGLDKCTGYLGLSSVLTDNFTRPNSTGLGTNWYLNTTSGVLSIVSDSVQVTTNLAPGVAYSWNGQVIRPTQFSKITVGTAPSVATQAVGATVLGAAAGTQTYYAYICINDTGGAGVFRSIRKVVAGTSTDVQTYITATPCSATNTMELDALVDSSGDTHLIPILNGVFDGLLGEYTDMSSPIVTGQPGLVIFSNTGAPSITGWTGGNLPTVTGIDSIYTHLGRFTALQTDAPQAFANLPACAAGTEGSHASVKDSTTNTWGGTITGSGSDHVWAYCDGSNWTVGAK